jgi:proprotein convertase subtilisin/kexin type 5
MAIDNMCYSHCSPTQQYYYNSNCYSTCPSGTYISYTGVNCVACSDLCATCYGLATNCTSCDDSYYYNNTCLTQCPTGYYGANTFTCEICTSATADVCNLPLNFTTSVSI